MNTNLPKSPTPARASRKAKADELFMRADKQWEQGNLRSAFRLFLALAKAGDTSGQVNVGYFYDTGVGARPNRSAALYWYKRAYRRGVAEAAQNIGTIYRDEQKFQRALAWFKRASDMGDDDANLEIGKHYLVRESDPAEAIPYLDKVCESDRVSEASVEEARRLLKRAKSKLDRMPR